MPDVAESTRFSFQLTATDEQGAFAQDEVVIFATHAALLLELWKNQPLMAKINNDASPDLVYKDANRIYWKPKLGQGMYGPSQLLVTHDQGIRVFKTDDLDMDGDDDVIYAFKDIAAFYWLQNKGDGDFAPAVLLTQSWGENPHDCLPDSVTSLTFFDADNDGIKDAVWIGNCIGIYGLGNYELSFSKIGADQTFSTVRIISTYASIGGQNTLVESPLSMQMVDLNNDGKQAFMLETIGRIGDSGSIYIYNIFVTGDEGLQSLKEFRFTGNEAKLFDANEDGWIDFLGTMDEDTTEFPPPKRQVSWLNLGGFTFSEPVLMTPELNFDGRIDIDGDGDLDLYRAQYDADSGVNTLWWQQKTAVGYTASELLLTLPGTSNQYRRHGLRTLDFDGDGDQDFIVFTDYGVIVVYVNQGDGTFVQTL
jgi:hypothetical protein